MGALPREDPCLNNAENYSLGVVYLLLVEALELIKELRFLFELILELD